LPALQQPYRQCLHLAKCRMCSVAKHSASSACILNRSFEGSGVLFLEHRLSCCLATSIHAYGETQRREVEDRISPFGCTQHGRHEIEAEDAGWSTIGGGSKPCPEAEEDCLETDQIKNEFGGHGCSVHEQQGSQMIGVSHGGDVHTDCKGMRQGIANFSEDDDTPGLQGDHSRMGNHDSKKTMNAEDSSSVQSNCESLHDTDKEAFQMPGETRNSGTSPAAATGKWEAFGPSCARGASRKAGLKGAAGRVRRGVVVRLKHLEMRSDLNGAHGLCLGQRANGRWAVNLDTEPGIFNVRRENLQVVALGGATRATNVTGRGQKRTHSRVQASATSRSSIIEGIAALECEPLRCCNPEERAALRRKLLLKWHPDKAPSASKDLATNVMQAMQNLPQWHL